MSPGTDEVHGALHGGALAVRQSPEEARPAAISDGENGELPPRKTAHHLQPLRREILPPWSWWHWNILQIGEVPDPFARSLPGLSLVCLILLDDPEHKHSPAPDRVFVEVELLREPTRRLPCRAVQHIPQRLHEQVGAMDAADGAPGSS